MVHRKQLRALVALSALGGAIALLPHCNAADVLNAAQGCDGLDVKASKADATVKAFSTSAAALLAAANDVQAKWLAVCNAMNADLGEDTSKTSAGEACGVLAARIKKAADKGVKIAIDVQGGCTADIKAQANCEAECAVAASCDIKAKCEPGKLVVECAGECSGTCDVRAPELACNGTCEGTCTADVSAACTGECTGTCDAPKWSGTCEAGCSATFSGTCGGTCDGTCDGTATSGAAEGNCKGKCVGTCTAKATGSCEAKCTGNFSNGSCTGTCAGKCAVEGKAECRGTCGGTCSYTPGAAKCEGSCHGTCKVETAAPRCEGKLDCSIDANCTGSCQAEASAKVECGGSLGIRVEGDAALYASYVKHEKELAAVINKTLTLYKPVLDLADKTGAAIKAGADLTGAGIVCAGASLAVAVEAKASISVSFQASASVTASGSAS